MNPETDVQHHLEQARFYYKETEEFDKALQECEAAITLEPYLADAHNLRGMVLEELGRSLEAIGAYKKAIHLDPDFSEAEENLTNLKAEFAAYSRLVTIATFSYPTEAYLSKAKLEAEGIWSFVADAETVTANWLYSNVIGGVKLQVKKEDVEKAIEHLKGTEAIEGDEEELEEEDEVRCPQCGSIKTSYERYRMRLVFLSWLLLSFPIPFLKRQWKCEACGHSWKIVQAEE
jgi:tetratricopeptide (TPR) repeat protein